MEEFLLSEKHRPKKISDCILPGRIKKIFQEYVDQKQIPNLLLSGPAGTGKTTSALAMCEEIGLSYLLINSSDERGIDTFRTKIKSFASTMSFKGGRKVIILDEADYLTPESQAALRGAIEEFSNLCTFILTCNFKSKLIDAIHSRTTNIDFRLVGDEKTKMASKFFTRLENILQSENIDYDKPALAKLVEKFFPDFRRTLNEIQRVSVLGKIDAGTIADLSDVKNIDELFEFLKDKDFQNIRKWVIDNSDNDMTKLFRKIYDGFSDHMKPVSIPQAIVILARYQYQAAFVADNHINIMAMLLELAVDSEFE